MIKNAYLLAAQESSNNNPKNGPTPLQLNETRPATTDHGKTIQD